MKNLRIVSPLVLGIDIGTTSIAVQIVAADSGIPVETYSIDYHAGLDMPGFLDAYAANAEKMIHAATDLIDSALQSHPAIAAIGVTGQMHGIVCLDEKGTILSPLYTWQNGFGHRRLSEDDPRTICQVIKDRCGKTIPTGYGVVTYYALREFGLLPAGTARIVTIMDLLVSRLCGSEPTIHPTNAASLGGYDLTENEFRKNILKKLDIPPEIFSTVVKDYTVAGYYQTGRRSIPVAAAIGDNQAGVFGTLADNSMVFINVGTSSQISVICDAPIKGGEMRPYFDGKYICSGAALCGGRAYALLGDFVREILKDFGVEASTTGVYNYLNGSAERAWNTDLTVSTCFDGKRTNPDVRGSITGIGTQNFTPSDLSAGFLKGICAELYEMYCRMKPDQEHAVPVVSGNAMRRNPVLRRICGEYFYRTPLIPRHTEEAAFGAALYGAVSAGLITRQECFARIQYERNT